jgi:hypothetical protein
VSDTPKLAVPTAQVATIDADLPCFFCQYNLRTLALEGICPECGNPVQKCIRQGWLGFADPRWLARLRRGVTIMLWLIAAMILGWAAFIAYVMSSTMAPTPSVSPPLIGVREFTVVFGLGLAVSWFIGAWHLTAPEPIPNEGYRQSSLGRATRTLQLIFGCSAVVYVVLVTGLFAFPESSSGAAATPADILGLITSIISAVAWSIGFVLLLIHTRRIARRDLKKGLGRLMTFLIWGGLATVSLQVMSLLPMRPMIITATTAPAAGPTTQGMAATQAYATSVEVSIWGSTTATRVRTSTMPVVVTTMPAVPAPMPFRGGYLLIFAMCAGRLLAGAWFVASVVALFWFRSIFARAISQNVADAAVAGAGSAEERPGDANRRAVVDS